MQSQAIIVPGTKGFLLWVKQQRPDLYAEYTRRGVGHLVRPGASAFNFSGSGVGTMGDTSDNSSGIDEFDYLSGGGPNPQGSPDVVTTPDVIVTAPTTPVDPAAAAPASATSSSLANILTSLASGVSNVLHTQAQAQQSQQILQAQIQQAQAGRPPLNLSALGIPIGSTSSTALLIGGGILVTLLLAGSMGKR